MKAFAHLTRGGYPPDILRGSDHVSKSFDKNIWYQSGIRWDY